MPSRCEHEYHFPYFSGAFPLIYAIQSGESGPIKFGLARNPKSRLAELQIGNPEKLRLLVEVNIQDWCERQIHEWLRKDRIRGEWFRPSESVHNILSDLVIRAAIGNGDQTWPDAAAFEREYFKRQVAANDA